MYLDIKYIVLNIKVFPNSKKDNIEFNDSFIKINITSATKHNRANIHILKILFELFNVSINNIIILRGKNSSNKKIKIINPQTIPFQLLKNSYDVN